MYNSSRNHPARRTRERRRGRPRLEILENRLLLSTVDWINSSGGDWDTPSNWSTSKLPGSGDDVVIDTSGITVTHSTGASDSIHSLTSQATLSISSGSLSIAAASTIDDLNLSGGTITGGGGVTVKSSLSWTDGTMSGAGTTTVAEGGTLNMSGVISLVGRTLVNAGTATWSRTGQYDSFAVSNGATIDNQAVRNFSITSDLPLNGSGTPPATFNNAGTVIRSGATGAAVFSVPFNNSGSLQVQSGELDLAGNGDSTGSFAVEAGATLGFGYGGHGGTQTLESGSQIGGAGTASMNGATVNLLGTSGLGILAIDFGTIDFSSTSPLSPLRRSRSPEGRWGAAVG